MVAFGGTLLDILFDLFIVGAHIIEDRNIRGRLCISGKLLGVIIFKGFDYLSVGFVHL